MATRQGPPDALLAMDSKAEKTIAADVGPGRTMVLCT